jgi:hypothetical protein
MPTELVKCEWCGRDCYPNELRYSHKLECSVCTDCDRDNNISGIEVAKRKRERAKEAAWQNGCGWVK